MNEKMRDKSSETYEFMVKVEKKKNCIICVDVNLRYKFKIVDDCEILRIIGSFL